MQKTTTRFEDGSEATKSERTGAGDLRVHVLVDGCHPAENQRPALLKHGME